MSARRFGDFESETEELIENQENVAETPASTKLERRRRIEEILEAKLLREELDEF